jgi:hypothetical protein
VLSSFSGVSRWFDARRIIALLDISRTILGAGRKPSSSAPAASSTHDWLVVTALVPPVDPEPELAEPEPELVEPEPELV